MPALVTKLKQHWALAALPIGALLLAGLKLGLENYPYLSLVALSLLACILACVHQADEVAEQIGEPFGTLLLAVAMTVIEVGLILSLMLAGGPAAEILPRDTVFSAIMIILNGIIGACLVVGSSKHGEQSFTLFGVSASLAALTAISVLTLMLPNFTTTIDGPFYSRSQLAFIAVVSLVLYGAFILFQTVQHREYFLARGSNSAAMPSPRSRKHLGLNIGILVVGLVIVVLVAKSLAPVIENIVSSLHAPQALVGVIIATIILLPEAISALRAARRNELQTSMNLALGSAMASIGLTIPVVAITSLFTGWPLMLGLDTKSSVLLVLSLFVSSLSLGTGRTTSLQGVIHLVIFAVYLFTTLVP